jgi:kynurenine formamidase
MVLLSSILFLKRSKKQKRRMIPKTIILLLALLAIGCGGAGGRQDAKGPANLWQVYNDSLKKAKYVDLTHTIAPTTPVWKGFGRSKFGPTVNPETGKPYTYEKDGFEATHYDLSTDQLGTQLDPPAHWAPEYPAIDELPATYTIRQLVVISIADRAAKDPGYQMTVEDIREWESRNGQIPEGSVVFIRSDWSKAWPDPALATKFPFPGITLDALKFLHLDRKILFHGHEALDTDTTPNLDGESWLMHNGYTQAEGVANLDQVPETGALVAIGYPKFEGGTGGYARYIAICPPDWKYGVSIEEMPGAPLQKMEKKLTWNDEEGTRTR